MKLKFDVIDKFQPDPFILDDGDKLYIYASGKNGVSVYSATDLFGTWHYEGICYTVDGRHEFWAPSVIKLGGKYYLYASSSTDGEFEYMQVAESDSPIGPFVNKNCLYNYFSIDSHVVKTDAGLYMWYAADNTDCDRIGTRIFVDKMIDPYTAENDPKEVVVPGFDEEIFMRNRFGDGKDWHTIEGAFWFQEGDWQYVMYSGGCYENDSYHIGYAAAKTTEPDLKKVDFTKHTDGGKFDPVLIKNGFEEGTGHHSVIKYNGEYYAIYHARDIGALDGGYSEQRTARVCKLHVKDGIITAERYQDRV